MAFIAWNPSTVNPRLVPPTWAVSVEIFFYLVICLGASRTFARVKIWLFFSMCYVAFSYAAGWSWGDRYFSAAAASLPFALGSAIYFLAKRKIASIKTIADSISAKNLFIALLANCLVWGALYQANIGSIIEMGFYLNMLFCTLLTYKLVAGERIFSIRFKIDKAIGDYSYPIYLLHWQSGLLASYLVFGEAFHEFSPRGIGSFLVAVFVGVALSYLLINSIDSPVQRVRAKIKKIHPKKLSV